jgi:hypothetical protein
MAYKFRCVSSIKELIIKAMVLHMPEKKPLSKMKATKNMYAPVPHHPERSRRAVG